MKVDVVNCPDLKKPPFGLLRSGISCLIIFRKIVGLSGQSVVCDVGSMKYLLPVADKSKVILLLHYFRRDIASIKLQNCQKSLKVR